MINNICFEHTISTRYFLFKKKEIWQRRNDSFTQLRCQLTFSQNLCCQIDRFNAISASFVQIFTYIPE